MDERCRITSGGDGFAQAKLASGKVPQKTDRLGSVVYWLGVRVKRWGKSPPRFVSNDSGTANPTGSKTE